MTIGVISDTHGRPLPAEVVQDLKKTDLIVHAGDVGDYAYYEELARIKEIKAVYGNMDIGRLRRELPAKIIFPSGRFKIGVFHGYGAAEGLVERVRAEFRQDAVDAIVFGHSHSPFNERIADVLYFNPGSPNDTVFAPFCSYGILTVTDEGITGKIKRVTK